MGEQGRTKQSEIGSMKRITSVVFSCVILLAVLAVVANAFAPSGQNYTEVTDPSFGGYEYLKYTGVPLELEMQRYIRDACERYDVPMGLVLGVIEAESSFRPGVWNKRKTCYGLMQVHEINFGWLRDEGIDALTYPGNIDAGVLILSGMLDKYDDVHMALMAYNYGTPGALKQWKQGIFSTKYTRAVVSAAERWERGF